MPAPLGSRFAGRLAVFYAALFLAFGVQLPFFPLWLGAKGLDAPLIGLVLAIPMAVRVAAIPLATAFADRHDALRAALIAAAAATALAYAIVGAMHGAIAIIVACAVAAAVYAPINALTDAYALRGLAAGGRAYGPVRLWGSTAFLIGMFVAGAAADLMPARYLIWLIVVFSTVATFAALALAPLPESGGATPSPPPRHLLRQPLVLVVLAAAALIQASHAVYYGFSVLAWTDAGFGGMTVATLWALGVIAEIVLFAMQARLPHWLTPIRLLIVGAAGGVLRWGAMALDPPAALLPALQMLHALSFGCTHLGALACLARAAPLGYAARAQGYLAIALGIANAGAMALSGWLYAAYAGSAYAAMALMAAAGGAGALVAERIERRGVE
jgi:PPP family 3-phenylpropionic acid transporter